MSKKRMLLVLAGMVGCAGTALANAPAKAAPKAPQKKADLKIGFVNSFRAMRESADGQEAGQDLQAKQAKMASEIKQEEQKILQAANEFKGKASTMSEAAREKEQKGLLKMERDYKAKVEEYEGELKMAMETRTQELAKEVESSAVELAKMEDLDAVVDTMTGRVVYTKEGCDYTGKLITKMDGKRTKRLAEAKKAPAPVKVASAKAPAKKEVKA